MLNAITNFRHELVLKIKRLIFRRTGEPYTFSGRTLYFNPGTRPVQQKYRNSANAVVRFDALQIDYYENNISTGDVVVDIGGHNGQCALLMASLARVNGRVITFEPDLAARNNLIENIKRNTDVAVIDVEPFAVSDSTGEAQFFGGNGNANSSLAAVGSVTNAPATVVKTIALDDYLSSRGIENIALVKIDIEGAEIHALRGAGNLLKSECEFLVELHPYAWEEFGVNFDELLMIAEKSNRELVYLGENEPLVDNPRYGTVLMRKRECVGS